MPCTLRGLRSGVQGGRARKNLAVKEKECGGNGGRKRNLLRVYNARGAKTAARRAGRVTEGGCTRVLKQSQKHLKRRAREKGVIKTPLRVQ